MTNEQTISNIDSESSLRITEDGEGAEDDRVEDKWYESIKLQQKMP